MTSAGWPTLRDFGAIPIQADVTSGADVERTYREVFQAFGHLDVPPWSV